MVRKIAAALKLIGKGEKDGAWLTMMLDRSITDTLQPMEPNGLILMNVKYPGITWNIDSYARSRELEEIHELFVSRETAARILDEIERGMR